MPGAGFVLVIVRCALILYSDNQRIRRECPIMYTDLQAALEDEIRRFGTNIFQMLGAYRVAPWERAYWNNAFTKLTIDQPALRASLFRLVDVLPALDSNEALLSHLDEYLSEPVKEIHPALQWLLSLALTPALGKITARAIRLGVSQMARVFIAGETPSDALPSLSAILGSDQTYTVDLLGEFSLSEDDAEVYLERYLEVIEVLSAQRTSHSSNPSNAASPVCISVKLSALYSQTSMLNFDKSVEILSERLTKIARKVRDSRGSLYVDAEDSGNNPIIYETFKRVFGGDEFKTLEYPGIVVQAYAQNAHCILDDLLRFAQTRGAPIAVRLVKGAYWDFERVIADQQGWDFPLYSEKSHSDYNYEVLSKLLLDNVNICRPAFASHNIRSLSHACCYAAQNGVTKDKFEIQILFGMADAIAASYKQLGYHTRFYVPIGSLIPGMGYLVRRLLENSSNESFLRHTFFESADISYLLSRPSAPPTTPSLAFDQGRSTSDHPRPALDTNALRLECDY
jgi:RHH-type transcriptional regulator, proline utilization regulon repressor / proline dehydrogenase / delta 1-pyrroline-5-carboxylate dehydrogenase